MVQNQPLWHPTIFIEIDLNREELVEKMKATNPTPAADNTKIEFAMHNARKHEMKENGLPKGYSLYWHDPRPPALRAADPDPENKKKYIYVKWNGRPTTCRTRDWREALDFVEKLRREQESEQRRRPIAKLTINSLLDRYVQYLEDKNQARGKYKPETAQIVKACAKSRLRPVFGTLRVDKLIDMPEKIREYRLQRQTSLCLKTGKPANEVQYTIDHELGYLRAAYNRAVKLKIIPKVIVPEFGIDKKNAHKGARSGMFTEKQKEILSEKLPRPLNLMLQFCLLTGARKKETRFILRTSVNWTERLVTLRPNETKADEQRGGRTLFFTQRLAALLEAWEQETKDHYNHAEYLFHLEGEQITDDLMEDLFNRTCEQLGWHVPKRDPKTGKILKDKKGRIRYLRSPRWHDSRRNASTGTGKLEGVTETDVKRVHGMTDQTRMRYDQTQSAVAMRDAFDKLEGAPSATIPVEVVPKELVTEAPLVDEIETKLIKLKTLFTKGLLDDVEFKEQKTRLLAQL
jgi:hypothetical protein